MSAGSQAKQRHSTSSHPPAPRSVPLSFPLFVRLFERLYHSKLTSECRIPVKGSRSAYESSASASLCATWTECEYGSPREGETARLVSREQSFEWMPGTAKTSQDLPLLVFFHGGAWVASDRDDPGQVHRRFLSSLVTLGFDCINANYRLVGQGAQTLADSVADVATLIGFLNDQNWSDVQRRGLVLVGHSAGGHLVLQAQLMGLLKPHQSLVRGICSIGGVYDLLDFRRQRSLALGILAVPWMSQMSAAELKAWSPRFTKSSTALCPVRLIHGSEEGFLKIQAEDMLLALQAQKALASLKVFENHSHLSLLRASHSSSFSVSGAGRGAEAVSAKMRGCRTPESIVSDVAEFAAECGQSVVRAAEGNRGGRFTRPQRTS